MLEKTQQQNDLFTFNESKVYLNGRDVYQGNYSEENWCGIHQKLIP